MKWRILLELTETTGSVQTREMVTGDRPTNVISPESIGLSLAESKSILAAMQTQLVQAQTDGYCDHRRKCSHCGSRRSIKDWRTRQLTTLFGVVQVAAPRFNACRCGIASRRIVSPLAEIMPDRCTPEYERILAKMGSLAAYGRAVALMAEFLPLGHTPAIETARRRTLQVGARLEQQILAAKPLAPPPSAQSIVVSVDGGHVKSIRSYASEFGLTAAKGMAHLDPLIERIQADESLPVLARELFAAQAKEYQQLQAQIDEVDVKLKAWYHADECGRRLAQIPGVGPIGAALLMMKTPAPEMFRSGRQFAAWIGLTPKDHSTGGKVRLGVITRAGDEALRSVLVVGATALLRFVANGKSKSALSPWLGQLLKRKPAKLVAVALANKLARIAWKLMVTGQSYVRKSTPTTVAGAA
jgi:hypothetical protein